jgi:hypothetical protein
MPSHTAAEALIQLYALGGLPWGCSVWQELTGVRHGLFPRDDRQLPKGWTRDDARDIQSFFHQYNQIPPGETTARHQFASSKNDTVPGRKKWTQFIQNHWKSWGIHSIMVEALNKHAIHPLTIINSNTLPIHIDGVFNNAAWPHSDLYIPVAIDTIAMSIFGPEAFGDTDVLPSPLRQPVKSIIQRSWSRIRDQLKSDMKRLDEIEKSAIKAFNGTYFFFVSISLADMLRGRSRSG